ncbi:MFS transporter [Amycolatopsis keratiniphila subsp. keratiniphila]|uniref:MFS transporter n=2 Tax=Amycolatopsis keratiniphila TaxID=129921 RepID=A0A1W2LSE0_9PSEU|nr:MFS transporter [Amycolatopsis keratiniphila]ONF67508.1 MFS transporter [Amycolatopsis keratiniphila subsp. keratiniphila]
MGGRAWGVLVVLCGAIFLEGIDVAMLNVALPSIRAELGLSTATLSGVVSAYVLGYGGFMLLGGRAADLYGRRRMFVGWLVVFLVFSGLGGFATEGWMLLLARFVTGVAAAFMTPAGLSIITTSFEEGPKRNKALLFYAGTGAGGFSLGLFIGGLLARIDWRWVFFTPVILSAVILLAALWLIKEPAREELGPRRLDLAGAVTVTAAMLLIAYAVVRLEHPGQGWGWTVASFAGGVAALVAFVSVERRSPAPLVRLGILKSGPLVRANVSALLFAGSFFGFQFLVTLYLQELRGWSTVETSLALLAVGIDAILAPTLTPRLVARFGNTRLIFGGLVLAAVSYALFLPLGLDWTYAAMFPSMIILGLGFALAYGPLTIVATDGIAEDEQGLAGGLLYTAFQFGAALGLSAVTAVNVAVLGAGGSPEAALGGFRAALVVPLVMAVLAAIVIASGRQRVSAKEARLASEEAIPAS